jgi:ElaB/YqjD/DUF883 family membrane-anchored ribosome-binding protein
MAEEPEVIRQQIEETRSSLADKIETLESEVRGTIREATATVNETVENVKETVESTISNVKETVGETVDTVKETFNLQRHYDEHPWACLAATASGGFLLGSLIPSSPRVGRNMNRMSNLTGNPPVTEPRYEPPQYTSPAARYEPAPVARSEPGIVSSMMHQFSPELDKLKGLAIGVAVGVVRDLLKDMIPPNIAPQVNEVISGVTTKLGGEHIEGPILSESEPSRPYQQASRRY